MFSDSLTDCRIHFSDGSLAVVKDQSGSALKRDHRYMIFATWRDEELRSTSADQGLFEFAEEGSAVHPFVSEEWNPLMRIKFMSPYDFLHQVRALSRQGK